MKTVSCREAGFDCDHVVKGETEEEVIKTTLSNELYLTNLEIDRWIESRLDLLLLSLSLVKLRFTDSVSAKEDMERI